MLSSEAAPNHNDTPTSDGRSHNDTPTSHSRHSMIKITVIIISSSISIID